MYYPGILRHFTFFTSSVNCLPTERSSYDWTVLRRWTACTCNRGGTANYYEASYLPCIIVYDWNTDTLLFILRSCFRRRKFLPEDFIQPLLACQEPGIGRGDWLLTRIGPVIGDAS